jgi:hypothetical protein
MSYDVPAGSGDALSSDEPTVESDVAGGQSESTESGLGEGTSA